MEDPPREEAIATIEVCRAAGIRVVMITGDQPATARGIADQLGLTTERVLTGREAADLDESEVAAAVRDVDVFARVAPEQKLRIVEALQEAGEVVAVTGDGVNDAPALSQADVGVAMGQSGTDVARDAADIVLADDNIATVRSAVEEGRRVFANIRKSRRGHRDRGEHPARHAARARRAHGAVETSSSTCCRRSRSRSRSSRAVPTSCGSRPARRESR